MYDVIISLHAIQKFLNNEIIEFHHYNHYYLLFFANDKSNINH